MSIARYRVRYFGDLLQLPWEPSGQIEARALREVALPMPDEVLEQFCLDHGRNEDFQSQYRHLDLHRLKWTCHEVSGETLVTATVFPRFAPWVASVSRRAVRISEEGWSAADRRVAIAEHWRVSRTWIRPPILIARKAVRHGPQPLHLVEGHTRLGLLGGLIGTGWISPSATHRAWIGEMPSRSSKQYISDPANCSSEKKRLRNRR